MSLGRRAKDGPTQGLPSLWCCPLVLLAPPQHITCQWAVLGGCDQLCAGAPDWSRGDLAQVLNSWGGLKVPGSPPLNHQSRVWGSQGWEQNLLTCRHLLSALPLVLEAGWPAWVSSGQRGSQGSQDSKRGWSQHTP